MDSSDPGDPDPTWYDPGPFTAMPFENTDPKAPQHKGVIYVFLPVDKADLYLNGQKMHVGAGKTRGLVTPLLPPNREYQYYVTMEYTRNGETIREYRKLDLGADEYVVADFTRPPLDNPVTLPAGPVDPNQAEYTSINMLPQFDRRFPALAPILPP